MRSLGIDIGATNIRYGMLINRELTQKSSEESKIERPEMLAEQCRVIVNQFSAVDKIGIVMPGPLDKDGILHDPPNFPHWGTVDFRGILAKTLDWPFILDRDSVGALIGEWKMGIAKNKKNVTLLTIGSGIGGAAVVDGNILREHHGFAGEFGHALVGPPGKKCGLGHDGCAEAWASGSAINRGVSLEEATDVFARLLKTVEMMLDPELIVLSGGMIAREDYLSITVDKAKKIGLQTDVKRAKLGEWSGVVGAALLATEGERERAKE